MASYKILSLDGGGIRGLLTAIILERLNLTNPGWLDKVDLLAGTSTGGIIALGLAHGLTPTQLRNLYEKKGQKIFDDSWLDDLKDIGGLTGAEYDNKNLRRELNKTFANTRLKDIKKRVLIPAFDLDNENKDVKKRSWAPKFFHNFPGPDSDGTELVRNVALYTSAAPTYFPSVEGYVDGGVVANNPSVAALAQTQDTRSFKTPPKLKDVVLLSISTGKSLVYIKGKKHDWGYAHWGKSIIQIMMDGVTGVADYQCRQILKKKYYRIEPMFPPNETFNMDDVTKIPGLVSLANAVDLKKAITWIRRYWR
jgi:patatin-like phospholipase/acyl hydrolase